MTPESQLEQATRARKNLRREADLTGFANIDLLHPSVAALMLAFPADMLRRYGILVLPKTDGNIRFLASSDRQKILEQALSWATKDESVLANTLVKLYKAVYMIGQASVNIDPRRIGSLVNNETEALIRAGVNLLPPLEVFFDEDGGFSVVPENAEAIQVVGATIMEQLQGLNPQLAESLLQQGWNPQNMLQRADN